MMSRTHFCVCVRERRRGVCVWAHTQSMDPLPVEQTRILSNVCGLRVPLLLGSHNEILGNCIDQRLTVCV